MSWKVGRLKSLQFFFDFLMQRFFFIILFLFSVSICFAQSSGFPKTDTLKINKFDIILIRQNNQIINKDGGEKFLETWAHAKNPDRYLLMSEIDAHIDFFKGFSPEQMESLLGKPNKYGSYYIDNPVDEQASDPCVIEFIYENGGLSALQTNCP